MASEIDKLTRYALKSNAIRTMTWIGKDDAGALLDRDGVLAAVAAIEERHAREVTDALARGWVSGLHQLRLELRVLNVTDGQHAIEAIDQWISGKIKSWDDVKPNGDVYASVFDGDIFAKSGKEPKP